MFNTARIEALEVANLMEAGQGDDRVSAAARHENVVARILWMTTSATPTDAEFPLGRNDRRPGSSTPCGISEGNRLAYKPVNMKPLTRGFDVHSRSAHLLKRAKPAPHKIMADTRTFEIYRYNPDDGREANDENL